MDHGEHHQRPLVSDEVPRLEPARSEHAYPSMQRRGDTIGAPCLFHRSREVWDVLQSSLEIIRKQALRVADQYVGSNVIIWTRLVFEYTRIVLIGKRG